MIHSDSNRLNITLSGDVLKTITAEADCLGVSKSEFISLAVAEYSKNKMHGCLSLPVHYAELCGKYKALLQIRRSLTESESTALWRLSAIGVTPHELSEAISAISETPYKVTAKRILAHIAATRTEPSS